MAAPEEILAFPLTVYLSVVGTAMPDVGDLPAAFDPAWAVLGVGGALDYDDNGVTVSHSETTFDVIPAGSTMTVKRFRTAEDLLTKLNLLDVSAETYAKCMNNSSVTTVAAGVGVAGSKKFSLFRGDKVAQFAVLLRGVSPIDNDLNMQFEIPKAFLSVNGDVPFNKGVATILPIEIQMIRHSDADDPICNQQTAVAS